MEYDYIYPTERHDVSDSFDDHRNRRPPSVNPGTDYKTWTSDFSTHHRKVFAVSDGVITTTSAGNGIWYIEYRDSYGNVHQDLHLSDILVSRGQNVKQGEVIGITGDSGSPGSPHLHHVLKINGINVDFELYVNKTHAKPITKKEKVRTMRLVNVHDNNAEGGGNPKKLFVESSNRSIVMPDDPTAAQYAKITGDDISALPDFERDQWNAIAATRGDIEFHRGMTARN